MNGGAARETNTEANGSDAATHACVQRPGDMCQGRCRVRYGAWRSSAQYRDCATRFVRDRSSLRQIAISLIPLLGIGWFIPRLHAFPADNTPVVTRAAALLSLCSYCRR